MTAHRQATVAAAAHRVVTMLHEVEAGRRPPRVLLPLFDVHLRGAVRRTRQHPGPVARLHRLAVARTVDGSYEVVAVSRRGDRFVAVGLRLTRVRDGQWLVTDVAAPGIHRVHPPPLSDPPGPAPSAATARR